jgi:dihydroflavonol-4-reductase
MDFETVTVTGATGHLGNVLVRELVRRGKRVRALVLPDDDARSLVGLPVETARGDVTLPASLPPAFRGAEVVFHLAGVVSISSLDDDRVLAVNAGGTRNVVAACREAGVRRLVHTGSVHSLVEPGPGEVLDESAGFDPSRSVGAYGRSKAEGALAVAEAARSGLDAVLVLPVAVIGPFDYRLSPIGELIALFARRLLPAIVDGGYDFVDVRDVALGQLSACDRGRRGESYLLTAGHLKVRELMRLLSDAAGRRPPRVAIPLPIAAAIARLAPAFERLTGKRALITPYSIHTLSMPFRIDGRRAREELGFDPMPLERSLADAWRWMTADPDSPLRRRDSRVPVRPEDP